MSRATLVSDMRAELLESPVWDPRSARLVAVDILSGRVLTFDEDGTLTGSRTLGQPVGAVVPRSLGGWIAALADGFQVVDDDPQEGLLDRRIGRLPWHDPSLRANDAKADPSGGLWAGWMEYDGRPGRGVLTRLETDHEVVLIESGLAIPNGMGWSPTGDTMYSIDSARRRIDAYTFDVLSGARLDHRVAVDLDDVPGMPDGMTVDVEGFLWVAMWNGGQVRRYAPDGRLDGIVQVPVSQVTSCTFGGSDLRTLFVTSARYRLDDAQLRQEPFAGGLFAYRPGVRGQPADQYLG